MTASVTASAAALASDSIYLPIQGRAYIIRRLVFIQCLFATLLYDAVISKSPGGRRGPRPRPVLLLHTLPRPDPSASLCASRRRGGSCSSSTGKAQFCVVFPEKPLHKIQTKKGDHRAVFRFPAVSATATTLAGPGHIPEIAGNNPTLADSAKTRLVLRGLP
jgi:hypothetical protein